MAEPEDIKPEGFIGHRFYRSIHAGSTGAAPAGLVHEVHRIPLSEKNRLESFPSVRRSFKGSATLAGAMEEYKAYLLRIRRYLVKDIPLVHMFLLPRWRQGMGLIVGARLFDYPTPDGEAALVHNN